MTRFQIIQSQDTVYSRQLPFCSSSRPDETDPSMGAPNPISVPSSVIQGAVNYIVQNHIHVVTDSEGLVVELPTLTKSCRRHCVGFGGLKAGLAALLMASVIGLVLAALFLGSVIASLLVILVLIVSVVAAIKAVVRHVARIT